jgi:hypothetical protein
MTTAYRTARQLSAGPVTSAVKNRQSTAIYLAQGFTREVGELLAEQMPKPALLIAMGQAAPPGESSTLLPRSGSQ